VRPGSVARSSAANVAFRASASELGKLPGVELVEGDLLSAGALARPMQGCRYLVHCAALYSFAPRDRAQIMRVNVSGTAALLDAARTAGIERAVVTSSSATVGPSHNGRLATELDFAEDGHDSAYHRSKLLQERAAMAARVPAVLVLPTAPIGPGDARPTPTGKMVLDFARGKIFARPPGSGGLNLVAVEDVAQAHVAALERGRERERYIIGGENLSFDQLWHALSDLTGQPEPRWKIPYGAVLALGYADEVRCRVLPRAVPVVPLEGVRMSLASMHVDCSKAAAELGFKPSPVRDALTRAVAWYRSHGYVA